MILMSFCSKFIRVCVPILLFE